MAEARRAVWTTNTPVYDGVESLGVVFVSQPQIQDEARRHFDVVLSKIELRELSQWERFSTLSTEVPKSLKAESSSIIYEFLKRHIEEVAQVEVRLSQVTYCRDEISAEFQVVFPH